jgi:beta-fructofuranosidase
MALRLDDRWIWDFWFAQDGPDYHLFYLQASRLLGNHELRHWNVSIGHAVSQDLRKWHLLPDALHPNSHDRGAWDDYTTWTGSIIRHQGLWYLFYTGGRRSERGRVQRIGMASSANLIDWQRCPQNPLMRLDPGWYELLDLNRWHDQSWRDPWVFQNPASGDFHAFVTARVNYGPIDGRAVIGHARSDDLLDWEVLPPVTEPGEFGEMEVPQLVSIRDRNYLFFSTSARFHAAARCRRTGLEPVTGIHYLVSNDPLGPFRYLSDQFLVGDGFGSLYSGRVVRGPGDGTFLMACRCFAPDGSFVGELTDPMPLQVEDDGKLSVNWVAQV